MEVAISDAKLAADRADDRNCESVGPRLEASCGWEDTWGTGDGCVR